MARAVNVVAVSGVYLSAIVLHNAYLALTPIRMNKGRYFSLFEEVFQCNKTGVLMSGWLMMEFIISSCCSRLSSRV